MTQPGTPGSIVPRRDLDDLILRRFRDLERRTQQLEANALGRNGIVLGPRGGITVPEGGSILVQGGIVRVEDDDGNRAVELGLLDDDSYGLQVTDPVSGDTLPLSRLAFGLRGTSNTTLFTCAGNGIWRTDPTDTPVVASVSTGRLLILVSAVMYSSISASNAVLSWDLAGPTPAGPDQKRALVTATAAFPAAGYGSSTYAFLHTGLAPGSYTITPRYRCDQYGGAPDAAYYENRSLVAFPF